MSAVKWEAVRKVLRTEASKQAHALKADRLALLWEALLRAVDGLQAALGESDGFWVAAEAVSLAITLQAEALRPVLTPELRRLLWWEEEGGGR